MLEMEMPTPCNECGDIFDLNEGRRHPVNGKIVICFECADRIQQENGREEEIQELLEGISNWEYDIAMARKRLKELGHE